MLENKDFCDYKTCVALKELDFNSLVDWYFKEDKSIVSSLARYRNTYIPRISLYEAQKWLREEKGLHIEIDRVRDEWLVSVVETKKNLCLAIKNRCQYEEALSEGIKEAVKILKEE